MRANEKVYQGIRRKIVSGEYSHGMHLSEPELCSRFQVSRSPVRVALQRLVDEGLARTESNRGAFVAELSQADIHEVFELREMLEARAAGLAALRRTKADVEVLNGLASEMSTIMSSGEKNYRDSLHRNNQEFHLAVVSAARSPRLFQFTNHLMTSSLTLGTFFTYSDDNLMRSVRFHQDIADAISTGDNQLATNLMEVHIVLGHREFMKHRFEPETQILSTTTSS